MTEQVEIDEARKAAQAFFDEMLEWEVWSGEVWDDEDQDEPRREKLKDIFEKHLSKKALQRDQARYDSLSIQEPSEFSEKIMAAEDAGKDKVWVYVAAGIVGGRARYLLVREDGNWKVDTRESDMGNAGRWAKEPHL